MDLVWPGAMETKLGFSWQNVMKHHETSWSIKGLSFSAQELPSKPSVSIYMHICQVSCTERRLRRYTCLPHHERRSTVKHATLEAAKKRKLMKIAGCFQTGVAWLVTRVTYPHVAESASTCPSLWGKKGEIPRRSWNQLSRICAERGTWNYETHSEAQCQIWVVYKGSLNILAVLEVWLSPQEIKTAWLPCFKKHS